MKQFNKQINLLLKDSSASAVTMMFDYYGIHKSFSEGCSDILCIEQKLKMKFTDPRFIPYLQKHEFEALLFSDVAIIANQLGRSAKLRSINNDPEDINLNNPPSKRLESIYEEYSKVTDGSILANEIGIEKMRKSCPHFNGWINKVLSRCKDATE